MKPKEREDNLYMLGKRIKIEFEEKILFYFLDKLKPNSYYLDIGCGTGEVAAVAKKKGLKVYATDFSLVALKAAKEEYSLDCIQSDLDSGLPFANESFDVVWAGDVIEHLFDPIFAFGEISRIMKKNGFFLVLIPNDLYISNRIKILFGKSYQHSSYIKFSQYKHHTFFSPALFEYMLKKNDLKIESRINLCRLPRMQKVIKIAGNGPIINLFAIKLIYKIVKI